MEKGSYNKFFHNKPIVEKCPNTHEVRLDSIYVVLSPLFGNAPHSWVLHYTIELFSITIQVLKTLIRLN
jgi:hypothetical protein